MAFITTEEFIEKAKSVHGDKYDYSKTLCTNCYTKVCVVCPEHGEFWQSIYDHLNGKGCPKCKNKKMWDSRGRVTTEEFIEKAKSVHGDKYDYSKVEYVNAKTKVCIICPEHGEFWQTPDVHLRGRGCRLCADRKTSDRNKYVIGDFIKKAKEVHGNKYDYSKVNYIDSKTKVCIICPEHGEFWQNPTSHLMGCGCKKCANKSLSDAKIYTTEEFIERAKEVYGNKYDYSKIEYKTSNDKICVVCPKHGEFYVRAGSFLHGIGCKKCGIERRAEKKNSNTEEFIEKAHKVHGDKYDYSKVKYVNSHTKVCIICPEHGEFWQTPNDHLSNEHGCRKCANNLSKSENEIAEMIKSYGIIVEQGNRSILNGKEIDIFLPEYNIGIEYDGLRWHSEEFCNDKNYHLEKTKDCLKHGIKLLHIFEDEYYFHKEIVISKIKHLLKIYDNNIKINARQCEVHEISKTDAHNFLEKNHIQGYSKSTIYLGCFNNETLVGVMTFIKTENKCWELNRFATDINCICRGVGGKMLSYFKKRYKWNKIKSFADRRWVIDENDNLYTKLGFSLTHILKPEYRYCKGNTKERIHKFNFRKQILSKKYNLPLTMTESEMVKELGYHKIWDCGLFKYEICERNS